MISIVRSNAKDQNHVQYIKIKACKSIIFNCQLFLTIIIKWGNKPPGVKGPHPLSYQTRARSAVNTHPVHAVSSTMYTT